MNSEEKNDADRIVVGVIRDLVKRVENLDQSVNARSKELEVILTEKQTNFERSFNDQFVALRQDIYKSYLDVKLKYDDHQQKHFIDDKRLETDALKREHRQFTLNLLFAGVIGLIILGFVITNIILWISRN